MYLKYVVRPFRRVKGRDVEIYHRSTHVQHTTELLPWECTVVLFVLQGVLHGVVDGDIMHDRIFCDMITTIRLSNVAFEP